MRSCADGACEWNAAISRRRTIWSDFGDDCCKRRRNFQRRGRCQRRPLFAAASFASAAFGGASQGASRSASPQGRVFVCRGGCCCSWRRLAAGGRRGRSSRGFEAKRFAPECSRRWRRLASVVFCVVCSSSSGRVFAGVYCAVGACKTPHSPEAAAYFWRAFLLAAHRQLLGEGRSASSARSCVGAEEGHSATRTKWRCLVFRQRAAARIDGDK